jgi:hypothetical protein
MDLPIYSDSTLRSSLQFANLKRLNVPDPLPAWNTADRLIGAMEGAAGVAAARDGLNEMSMNGFLKLHADLFEGREGAGRLRTTELRPIYRGQDCAPPEFIGRSLENLFSWIAADSFNELHPIEKCALAITRIADIWPFEFGNLTAAIVFANVFLKQANLTPFFVLPEHVREFEGVVAQSLSIETQPLINAIYQTVRREMEALAQR